MEPAQAEVQRAAVEQVQAEVRQAAVEQVQAVGEQKQFVEQHFVRYSLRLRCVSVFVFAQPGYQVCR